MLPASVKRLSSYSLHDAQVVEAHQKSGLLTLVLDTSSALSKFRGYCVHLCFLDVKEHVPIHGLTGQSWLYEEAHLSSRSRFALHVLLDKSGLEIEADQLLIKKFRRQLLTRVMPQEFRRYPIWEFARGKDGIDGQDESWICPVNRKTLPKNRHWNVVATEFTTRSGKVLHGFLIVATTDGDIKIKSGAIRYMGLQPLRVASRKGTASSDVYCSHRERNGLACALGKEEGDVFPVHYRLNANFNGERTPREGQIH